MICIHVTINMPWFIKLIDDNALVFIKFWKTDATKLTLSSIQYFVHPRVARSMHIFSLNWITSSSVLCSCPLYLITIFTTCLCNPLVCYIWMTIFTTCLYNPLVCYIWMTIFTIWLYNPLLCYIWMTSFTTCLYSPLVCYIWMKIFTIWLYNPLVSYISRAIFTIWLYSPPVRCT